MEAISKIENLSMSKDQISQFAAAVKEAVLSGNYDVLRLEANLRAIEEAMKQIRADVEYKEIVQREAAKYGTKTFKHHGVEFTLSERKNYDFTTTGDSTWIGLNDAITTAKEGMKEREKFLKAIPIEGTVDPETGELIECPVFSTTTVLSIKL